MSPGHHIYLYLSNFGTDQSDGSQGVSTANLVGHEGVKRVQWQMPYTLSLCYILMYVETDHVPNVKDWQVGFGNPWAKVRIMGWTLEYLPFLSVVGLALGLGLG